VLNKRQNVRECSDDSGGKGRGVVGSACGAQYSTLTTEYYTFIKVQKVLQQTPSNHVAQMCKWEDDYHRQNQSLNFQCTIQWSTVQYSGGKHLVSPLLWPVCLS
jgi:hypothetical protein